MNGESISLDRDQPKLCRRLNPGCRSAATLLACVQSIVILNCMVPCWTSNLARNMHTGFSTILVYIYNCQEPWRPWWTCWGDWPATCWMIDRGPLFRDPEKEKGPLQVASAWTPAAWLESWWLMHSRHERIFSCPCMGPWGNIPCSLHACDVREFNFPRRYYSSLKNSTSAENMHGYVHMLYSPSNSLHICSFAVLVYNFSNIWSHYFLTKFLEVCVLVILNITTHFLSLPSYPTSTTTQVWCGTFYTSPFFDRSQQGNSQPIFYSFLFQTCLIHF